MPKFETADIPQFETAETASKSPLFSGTPSERAKKRGLGIKQQEAQLESAGALQTEKQLGTAVKGITLGAEMAPFMLAAPFTVGTSLLGGAAIMGGAGLASGATRETISSMLGEQKKTPGQIAGSLGIDAVLGAVTEFGLTGLAKLGGALWERSLLKAAQKTDKGRAVAEDMSVNAFQPLEKSVEGRVANVRSAYESFLEKIANIPKGRGKTGQQLAGPVGGDVGDLVASVSSDLRMSQASAPESIGQLEVLSAGYGRPAQTERLLTESKAITDKVPWINRVPPALRDMSQVDLTKQPLDALIRMHSGANQLAWSAGKDVPTPARKAAREFARDLNSIILTKLSPEERGLFNAAKAITQKTFEYDTASSLARYLVRKAAIGSVAGLAGGPGVGTAAVIGDVALQAAEKKYAPMLLESWIKNNKASYQEAIRQLMHEDLPLKTVGENVWKGISRAVPTEIMERMEDDTKKYAQTALEKIKEKAEAPNAP